jgi:cytidine deaminase
VDDGLVGEARRALRRAHAPYSRFRVGAALLGQSGRVYVGVNVENASYGLTICAERAAVARAVADGERRFARLAIASSSGRPTVPCGACRQVLAEFAPNLPIVLAARGGARRTSLARLFPKPFRRGGR